MIDTGDGLHRQWLLNDLHNIFLFFYKLQMAKKTNAYSKFVRASNKENKFLTVEYINKDWVEKMLDFVPLCKEENKELFIGKVIELLVASNGFAMYELIKLQEENKLVSAFDYNAEKRDELTALMA